MNVSCPGCRTVYAIPATSPDDAPFGCQKCGWRGPVGRLPVLMSPALESEVEPAPSDDWEEDRGQYDGGPDDEEPAPPPADEHDPAPSFSFDFEQIPPLAIVAVVVVIALIAYAFADKTPEPLPDWVEGGAASPRASARAAAPGPPPADALRRLAAALGPSGYERPAELFGLVDEESQGMLLGYASLQATLGALGAGRGELLAQLGRELEVDLDGRAEGESEAARFRRRYLGARERWPELYTALARLARDTLERPLLVLRSFEPSPRVEGERAQAKVKLASAGQVATHRLELRLREGAWEVALPPLAAGSAKVQARLAHALFAEAQGEHARALQVLRGAPAKLGQQPLAELIGGFRARLLQRLVADALRAARAEARQDPRAAGQALEAFWNEHRQALAGTPHEAALRKSVSALLGPEARPEPAERAARFAAAAAEGRRRVAALRERIAREAAAGARARADELKRARAASVKKPLSLRLAEGYTFSGAVLSERDEQGFRVEREGEVVARSWESVPRSVALRVRRLGVREDDAGDQLRLGYWALKQRFFASARRSFARAAKLDPSLAGRLPAVGELEAAAKVFQGELTREGTAIEIRYPFQDAAEAKDWSFAPFEGTGARVKSGALEVTGSGTFLLGSQEIGFDERCDLSATIKSVSGSEGGCFGIGFDTNSAERLWYLVVVYPQQQVLALYRLQGDRFQPLAEKRKAVRAGRSTRVRLEVRGSKLRVFAKGETQLALNIPAPSWRGTRVFVGGTGSGRGARIRLAEVEVKGRVRYEWLRKSFGQLEALLYGALARANELPVFRPQSERPAPRPLSAADAFGLSGVDPKARELYRAAQGGLASDDWAELYRATQALTKALELSPGFALAYYARAQLLERIGRSFAAARDLELAQRVCPRFHEAAALHARVLLELGQQREALAKAEQALQLAPASAEARLARGLCRFRGDDLEGALADFELARAIDPWDEVPALLARNVRNVLTGPPWSRRFVAETKHYRVLSNTSQRSASEYGRLLEAARSFYAQSFPLREAQTRKAKVLIFDTSEGYHAYAELSLNDRVESTLGVYLPRYRQLLLYEDKDDETKEATTQVLFHEGFHQYMHALVPDNAIPYWLNEGLAEFMSACRVEGERVVQAGLILPGRLRDLRAFVAANRGRPIGFPELMQQTPREFYSGPVSAKYAQAWAMVHFFVQGATPDTRRRYQRYLAALREGTSAGEAFADAWSGADWPGIERRWWAYVERMP